MNSYSLLSRLQNVRTDPRSPELLIDLLRVCLAPEHVEEELALLKRSYRLSKKADTSETVRVQNLKEDIRVAEMQLDNARQQEEETQAELDAFLENNPPPEPDTFWDKFKALLGDRDELNNWQRRRSMLERSHARARQRVEKLKQKLKRDRKQLEKAKQREQSESPRARHRRRLRARLVRELAGSWKWRRWDETGELFESVERTLTADPVVHVLKVADRLLRGERGQAEALAESWESGVHSGIAELSFAVVRCFSPGEWNTEALQRTGEIGNTPRLESLRQALLVLGGAPASFDSGKQPVPAAVLSAVAQFGGRELSDTAEQHLYETARSRDLPLLREAAGLRELTRGNLSRAAQNLAVEQVVEGLDEREFAPGAERWLGLVLVCLLEQGDEETAETIWEELFRLPKSSLFYLLSHWSGRDTEALHQLEKMRTPLYSETP